MGTDIEAALTQARQHQQVGRFQAAEQVYRQLLERDPDHAAVRYDFALMLYELGIGAPAIELLEPVLRARPDSAELQLLLGQCLQQTGQTDAAIDAYKKALAMDPGLKGIQLRLANLLASRGRFEDAETAFLRACSETPEDPRALTGLGNILAQQGRADEAETVYRKAIAADPQFAPAHHHLAFVRNHQQEDADIAAMLELFEKENSDPLSRIHLGFGLGKACEDLGQYPRAFEFYRKANALKHAHDAFDLPRALRELQELRSLELSGPVDAGQLPADLRPVFVVGMPRSGTSLTEQVLAGHSQLSGAGELTTLSRLLTQASANYPQGLENLQADAWLELARAYLDELRQRGSGTPLVIDKLPSNFAFLGIIRHMLPTAKVIYCRRNAMDTGLSCFKNHFASPTLGFTGKLSEIGTYSRACTDTMAHWSGSFPGWIHEFEYEQFVRAPEDALRVLLDYLGLPWEAGCLEFHKAQRHVHTASAMQVRQPVNVGSVGAWKRFEKELEPLRLALVEEN